MKYTVEWATGKLGNRKVHKRSFKIKRNAEKFRNKKKKRGLLTFLSKSSR